ncbi:MAG: glycosyltransferase family 87 protein [Terracidiphilus sp.]|jgi:hypothetical protein
MSKARLDGLYLVLLGSAAFVLLGTVLANSSSVAMVDFRVNYYPARCLMQNCDPYDESQVLRIARAEGGELPGDIANANHFARYLYLPAAFLFTLPFAALPWGLAHLLWVALMAGSLILGAVLMWDLGANWAPVISGALIGFLLANSELLMVLGNMAGFAIGLSMVAVWCFLRRRFVPAGILCLAISLAIKPQDAGLVWLYFLLAGGVYRKRALQTLLAAVALSLPGVLWVWQVSPRWMQELHSNLLAFSAHGSQTDPRLASMGFRGLGMMINLQTAVSAFWSEPRIYNLVTYLICGPLLLAWVLVTLRSRSSAARTWVALAAIAALSMLPVYHHQYDAKLLLLTVPACAMLWAEGGVIGWLALLLNTAGFVLTGDISWIALLGLMHRLLPASSALSAQIPTAMQVFSAPLILLLMAIFYLWIYVKRGPRIVQLLVSAESDEAPLALTS